MAYEVVIGLETHAELLTDSKLWCGCGTRFGEPANTRTCPVCLGMPGVLPVLNREAFRLAVKAALAMQCRINQRTFFDRKGYYYPDLPKNYQVSQNYCNLGEGGCLDIPVDGCMKRVRIGNVHLEEDAGKNLHVEHPGADYSLVDLNRAGVPLLEIVSEPDLRSVGEAEAYMQTLRQLLLYCRISDCKMQEGSLRFEASVSLRPEGRQEYGTRVEIKNLNSMKAVTKCLEYEVTRQTQVLDSGGAVNLETRLWNEATERSGRMRSKEEAQDYRYFPETDLVPFVVDEEWLARLRKELPELPIQRRARFERDHGLSAYDAQVLTDERAMADYFEACLAVHNAPKSVANWLMNDINAILNGRGIAVADFEVTPARLAELVRLADEGKVTGQAAREVLARMIETGMDAQGLVKEMGVEAIGDEDELGAVVDEAIAASGKAVQDYMKGKKAAVGAIMGQIMRLTRGKADAKIVQQILREKLEAMREA
ncbi:MAG: Asp-tRNA(Asn)/Glu-tRNA(Gln) amidotransferase subunit GatB [Candidatus Brocadiia bacterium]|jgi:aspartyl-tRNA(Asn)/glutamyl-tRNA(Gln) amidotransferase subunit B|nr:Asp-tRNA(Asn)/Glu-tRNA(Gln) amidotransferase subunit GatB [Candidatus Brocadiia bacterium]